MSCWKVSHFSQSFSKLGSFKLKSVLLIDSFIILPLFLQECFSFVFQCLVGHALHHLEYFFHFLNILSRFRFRDDLLIRFYDILFDLILELIPFDQSLLYFHSCMINKDIHKNWMQFSSLLPFREESWFQFVIMSILNNIKFHSLIPQKMSFDFPFNKLRSYDRTFYSWSKIL